MNLTEDVVNQLPKAIQGVCRGQYDECGDCGYPRHRHGIGPRYTVFVQGTDDYIEHHCGCPRFVEEGAQLTPRTIATRAWVADALAVQHGATENTEEGDERITTI